MTIISNNNTSTDNNGCHGDLHDYATGEYIRPATMAERAQSDDAGPEGAFTCDGRTCYVMPENGGAIPTTSLTRYTYRICDGDDAHGTLWSWVPMPGRRHMVPGGEAWIDAETPQKALEEIAELATAGARESREYVPGHQIYVIIFAPDGGGEAGVFEIYPNVDPEYCPECSGLKGACICD